MARRKKTRRVHVEWYMRRHDSVWDIATWPNEVKERFLDWELETEDTMQKQWVIECRADLSKEACELVAERIRRTAVHLRAELELLKENQKPQVVCFSEDFFLGREDIELLQASVKPDDLEQPEEEGISQELVDAVREMNK